MNLIYFATKNFCCWCKTQGRLSCAARADEAGAFARRPISDHARRLWRAFYQTPNVVSLRVYTLSLDNAHYFSLARSPAAAS
jgi:hypothetical protein